MAASRSAASNKSTTKRDETVAEHPRSKSGAKALDDTAGRAAAAWGESASFAKGKRPSDKLKKAELVQLYRTMLLARRFEEHVIDQFREGNLPGFVHVAIGQEAIASGVGHALGDGDFIGSTHRAHAHIIARGSSVDALMAEMMGRITGVCQGKGGSMHMADMSHNVVGANGVVGSGAPMMTGVALAQKELGTGNVAVAFYGDGATSQGNVHEAMNLAQIWKLPVVFICENNRYAESTPTHQTVPVDDLTVRGAAFGMKTYAVDGNDVLAVYDTAAVAAEHARSGEGPVYVVAETLRLSGHYVGDAEVYRPKGEAKAARETDPIPAFRAELLKRKVAEADIKAVEAEVEETMEHAVQAALAADHPTADDAMKHVYAEYPYPGPVLGI
ncbi:MAG: thiamine pyrophosphate-dependent dehydrogenase E1 component subunit alpha [Thermoleophilia bacterium]|nr:thiamine pyrophosphate-dependent dehydrogenase E1 component subunit alpha [Thermoleophilia bacterium]